MLVPESLIADVFAAPVSVPYPTMADRDRWSKVEPRDATDVLATAESFRAEPWPVLRAQDFARFTHDGDRIVYEKPYFVRRTRLTAAALAACLTGDHQWVVEALDGIWLILEETTWTLPAHTWTAHSRPGGLPASDDGDLDLFCAETAGMLAWISHLLGDQLDGVSPLIRERIRAEIRRRVIEPFLGDRTWVWRTSPVNNWNPWIHSNVLAAALLVELEPAIRQQVVTRAIEGLEQFIADSPADGGCDEGTTYWSRAGGSLSDCLWLLYDISGGRIDGFGHPIVIGAARYLPSMHMGATWVVNFADGPGKLDDRSAAYPLLRMGEHTGQDDAVRQALAMHADPSAGPLAHRIGSIGRLAGLLLDVPGHADVGYPFPADAHFPVTQVVSARERAGTSDGLYLTVKGGYNQEHHNHNDVGSFVVALDGRPLVVDIGVGTYTRQTFGPDRYSIFTMTSAYHNVPLVNGWQQPPGREYAARDWTVDVAPSAVRVGMDLAGAYPSDAKINSWRREAILQRGDGPGLVQLTDTWDMDGAPTELVWHLIVNEAVEVGHGRVLVGDPGTRRLVIAVDERVDVRVEQIPLGDERLTGVWGAELHRLIVTAGAELLTATGSLRTSLRTEYPGVAEPADRGRETP